MGDVKCAMCGEPWDAYGAKHGDMRPWEYELFRQGAGCPSCEGVAPSSEDHTLDHMRSIILDGATDNPDAFPLTVAPDAPRPAWQRPADPVVWSCAGCDTKIKRDLDAGDLVWDHRGAYRNCCVLPKAFYDPPPADVMELPEISSSRYCPACAESCDRCGAGVFRSHTSCTGRTLYTDSYAPGASFGFPDDVPTETLCVDCYEKATSEAEAEAREERESTARCRAVEEEIIEGFARAIFCLAWADWADEYHQLPAQSDVLEVAPETHPAAIETAEIAINEIEQLNGASIEDLAVRAFTAGEEHEHVWGRRRYAGASSWSEKFGFALGCEWLGTGIHWTDNHPKPDQPIKVPSGEFHVSTFADTVCGWRENGEDTGCGYLGTVSEFMEHPVPPASIRIRPGFRCPSCGEREEIYSAFPESEDDV